MRKQIMPLKVRIILVIISLSFLQSLQLAMSPVLSQVGTHYSQISVGVIQMLITGPSFLAMVIAILAGWLILKFSKKKLLLFACFVTGVTGVLPFFSDSFILLFICRMLYGIGLGLSATLNTAVVAEFFHGKERVWAMGIQAASVGTGMILITTLSGILGEQNFHNMYWIYIIGFISMIMIGLCLPDSGKKQVGSNEKIRLPRSVFYTSVLGTLFFLFLMSFTTNIAMHLSGSLEGDAKIAGILTGVFSGVQVLVGLVLGHVVKITGRFTSTVAMLSFSVGAVVVALCPSQMSFLLLGALLCGFSQGLFLPQSMVDICNMTGPEATAMASACFSCFLSMGQVISPGFLNTLSKIMFGEVTTSHVYIIAAAGMALASGLAYLVKRNTRLTKGPV